MAFDEMAQRFAAVDLDYQPDGSGFTDAGALLMFTGWGEDIDVEGAPPADSLGVVPEVLIGKLRVARGQRRRR